MLARGLRRAARGLAWLIIAASIALGAAGIVAGASPPPGDASRPELTARGDVLMAPGLAATDQGLVTLEGRLRDLLATGKAVEIDLVNLPQAAATPADVSAKLDAGDALVLAIQQQALDIQTNYAQLPFDASSDRISGRTKARLVVIRSVLGGLPSVAGDWQAVSAKATTAARLIDSLIRHDLQAGQAVLQGSNTDGSGGSKPPDFTSALTTLKTAMATLADATALRDKLKDTIDVSTLDPWLDRNRTYDHALQTYFKLALETRKPGILQKAFDAQEAARRALPATTAALIIIVRNILESGFYDAMKQLERIHGGVAAVARID